MGYNFNLGRAAGGSLAGGLSMGPWGLLLGAASGWRRDAPGVDSVLPKIDAETLAEEGVKKSGLNRAYSNLIGATTSSANDYMSKLMASGMDPNSAARIAEEHKQAGMSGVQDKVLGTESSMYGQLLNQYKPLELQRDEERQSYENMKSDQENTNGLIEYAPAIAGAALGNLSTGHGLLGSDWAKLLGDKIAGPESLDEGEDGSRAGLNRLLFGDTRTNKKSNFMDRLRSGDVFGPDGNIDEGWAKQYRELSKYIQSINGDDTDSDPLDFLKRWADPNDPTGNIWELFDYDAEPELS